MLEKINGFKLYLTGGLFILTGVLQMACSIVNICLLPAGLVIGEVDAAGNPVSGWGLVLAGLGLIGLKSAIAKTEPPK